MSSIPAAHAAAAAAASTSHTSSSEASSVDRLVKGVAHIALEDFHAECFSPVHQKIMRAAGNNPLLYQPEEQPQPVNSSKWDSYLRELKEAKANVESSLNKRLQDIKSNRSLTAVQKGQALSNLLDLLLHEREVFKVAEVEAELQVKCHEIDRLYRRGNKHVGESVFREIDALFADDPEGIDFALRFIKIIDKPENAGDTLQFSISVREPDRVDLEKYVTSTNSQVRDFAKFAILSLDEAFYQEKLMPEQRRWFDAMDIAVRALRLFTEQESKALTPTLYYEWLAYQELLVTSAKMLSDKLDNIYAINEVIHHFRKEMIDVYKTFPSHARFCHTVLEEIKEQRKHLKGQKATDFYRNYVTVFNGRMPDLPAPQTVAVQAVSSSAAEVKKKKKKKGKDQVQAVRYPQIEQWLQKPLPYLGVSKISTSSKDFFPPAFDKIILQKEFCYLEKESLPGKPLKKHYRAIVQYTLPDEKPVLAVVTISTITKDNVEICFNRYCSQLTPTEALSRAMDRIAAQLEEMPLEGDQVPYQESSVVILSNPTANYITLQDPATKFTMTIFPKRN